jgi:hypothetical protein
LSVFAGSFSVGADQFAEQGTISVINCSIAMIITILISAKLFMKIQENQEQENQQQELFLKNTLLWLRTPLY